MINFVWFRRDLRLDDNAIVQGSALNGLPTVYLFVIDEWFLQQPEISRQRVCFLFESLQDLDRQLMELGGKLHIFTGKSTKVIKSLSLKVAQDGEMPILWFNKDIQVDYGIKRDEEVVNYYKQCGWQINLELNYFLLEDETEMSNWRKEYYTFQNQEIKRLRRVNSYNHDISIPSIRAESLFEKYPQFQKSHSSLFIGGEIEATRVLDSFLITRSEGYHWKLSRPMKAQQGSTSHLSPHIAFGTVSSRQVYQAAKHQADIYRSSGQGKRYFALRAFRDRLRWRDSFTQRLYFKPWLKWQNRFPEFDGVYTTQPLSGEKQEVFQAWKNGITGFPLVDASMRQLKELGWMNFRMRAMCANFLTIILGISWHYGAEYFMQQLVDGDIAINHWQWQMQAGVTNPLSKTFRIYNPNKNLLEKDPGAEFVHHWIPELRQYSAKQMISAGPLQPLHNYQQPVVDYELMRKSRGKIISNIRSQVRKRLLSSKVLDTESKANFEAIKHYMHWKNQEYKKWIKNNQTETLF